MWNLNWPSLEETWVHRLLPATTERPPPAVDPPRTREFAPLLPKTPTANNVVLFASCAVLGAWPTHHCLAAWMQELATGVGRREGQDLGRKTRSCFAIFKCIKV